MFSSKDRNVVKLTPFVNKRAYELFGPVWSCFLNLSNGFFSGCMYSVMYRVIPFQKICRLTLAKVFDLLVEGRCEM